MINVLNQFPMRNRLFKTFKNKDKFKIVDKENQCTHTFIRVGNDFVRMTETYQ